MSNSAIPLRIGFLLLDRFTLSAFSTFLDPLRLASDIGDSSQQVHIQWDIMTVDDHVVSSSCGVEVHPTAKAGFDRTYDYLVVVGGLIKSRHLEDQRVEKALRTAAKNGISIIGLCTGVFPMITAGLLDGDICCVNWFHYHDLVERFHEVEPDTTNLYHIGTRHSTCAGGIGATCLSLKIVERHLGEKSADKAARILMVPDALRIFPIQPHDHVFKDVTDSFVKKALIILERSMSEGASIEDVASQLGVTSRQVERRFKSVLGVTPSAARRKMKMLRAQRLLETTDFKIIDISMECGYESPSQFSETFKKEFGKTPVEYRKDH